MSIQKITNIASFLVFFLFLIIIPSCKEEQEELKVGTYFSRIFVSIEDSDGKNSVLQWIETNEGQKVTTAEYIKPSFTIGIKEGPIQYELQQDTEQAWFYFSTILDVLDKGDCISWRFKMYPDDAEEILIEGKVIENKEKERKRDVQMQWSFRGVELSLENPKKVTLIRTDDGRYTLKQ